MCVHIYIKISIATTTYSFSTFKSKSTIRWLLTGRMAPLKFAKLPHMAQYRITGCLHGTVLLRNMLWLKATLHTPTSTPLAWCQRAIARPRSSICSSSLRPNTRPDTWVFLRWCKTNLILFWNHKTTTCIAIFIWKNRFQRVNIDSWMLHSELSHFTLATEQW